MLRRFAATLVAVLVLAVVSATPALAKPHKDPAGGGSTSTGSTGTSSGGSTGGSTGSGGTTSGTGSGTGTGTGTTSGSGTGTGTAGSSGSGSASSSNGSGPGKKSSAGKSVRQGKTDTAAAERPAPQPSRTTSSSSSRTTDTSIVPESSGASVVRASAAPVAADTGISALLPAPDPMLLPDTSTNAAAPVDVERASGFPQAVLALLIGAGVLSVAVTGTLLARRRPRRAVTPSAG